MSARVLRQSSFGLRDMFTLNVDIELLLMKNKRELSVWVNGKEEKQRHNTSKEQLAAKPVKYLTRSRRYLIIWYDLQADHMMMSFNGTDVSTLPIPELSEEIFRNKLVDKTIAGNR